MTLVSEAGSMRASGSCGDDLAAGGVQQQPGAGGDLRGRHGLGAGDGHQEGTGGEGRNE
jgi:hypothetical protein